MTAVQNRRADRKEALDRILGAAIDDSDVPGAVVLVTDHGGVLYENSFGVADLGSGRTMTTDALFRIVSMTKPVTSVALMQLVERRGIGLDDPAEAYLPELADLQVLDHFDPKTGAYRVRPAMTAPTVTHFLTHTSGLAAPFTSAVWRDLRPMGSDVFPFGGPLLFDPGERWHYGTSTDVIGRLVEVVSGESLECYFREHVLDPLGMDDTSFTVPEAKGSRLAAIHQRAGELMDGAVELQSAQLGLFVPNPIGGGGLASTAGDYGRFVRMVLNGGVLDGARVLRAETIASMGRNHIGAIGVSALRSAIPRSADFTFIADGRDKWGLGYLITADRVAGKRSPGSLSWSGINNTYFWIDLEFDIAGVLMMQFVPFADASALGVLDAFERGVYETFGRPAEGVGRRT